MHGVGDSGIQFGGGRRDFGIKEKTQFIQLQSIVQSQLFWMDILCIDQRDTTFQISPQCDEDGTNYKKQLASIGYVVDELVLET